MTNDIQGMSTRSISEILPELHPQTIDEGYLQALGVGIAISDATIRRLESGSREFRRRVSGGEWPPKFVVSECASPNRPLEQHNYTSKCPRNALELTPAAGACQVGCLYCLVTDGEHESETRVYMDYPKVVSQALNKNQGRPTFFYFSPKTEAFQPATLGTGVAHEVLAAFRQHYDEQPESQARLFIASKAGPRELKWSHAGESVLDLLTALKGRAQFCASIGMMPDTMHSALEPHAASPEERLTATDMLRAAGVEADSVLCQPIIEPMVSGALTERYFSRLAQHGIKNFKPELLTVCPENLAAIAQVVGCFSKDAERRMYETYLPPSNADHVKQRSRTAPRRDICKDLILMLMKTAERYGISVSVCAWVREQLQFDEHDIPMVNRNGYQCLGYQRRLFPEERHHLSS